MLLFDKTVSYFIIAFCVSFSLSASEVVNFKEPEKNKNVVFLLSTPRSGTNIITGCFTALTRKPISWTAWAETILNPSSKHRQHITYNRLNLPLVSDEPLLYRTHNEFNKLKRVPSGLNKLIFLTRNPKELIYRLFTLQDHEMENPDEQFIDLFLIKYLKAFDVFEAWAPNNRKLVFYEDFIVHDEEILLHLLEFMEESPKFLEDFRINKQNYLNLLLESYMNQHQENNGGLSAKHGPQKIYYTKNAAPETLKFIDEYLRTKAPVIWKKYLHRFKTK